MGQHARDRAPGGHGGHGLRSMQGGSRAILAAATLLVLAATAASAPAPRVRQAYLGATCIVHSQRGPDEVPCRFGDLGDASALAATPTARPGVATGCKSKLFRAVKQEARARAAAAAEAAGDKNHDPKSQVPWVAVVERGKCSFSEKAAAAAKAGAVGLVVINNEDGPLQPMGRDEGAEDVALPVVMIPKHASNALRRKASDSPGDGAGDSKDGSPQHEDHLIDDGLRFEIKRAPFHDAPSPPGEWKPPPSSSMSAVKARLEAKRKSAKELKEEAEAANKPTPIVRNCSGDQRFIAVAVATEETPAVANLRVSAAANAIPLEVIGIGSPYVGVVTQPMLLLEYLQDALAKNASDGGLRENDIVMHVDAYDTLFVGSSHEISAKFCSFRRGVVLGAERECLGCDADMRRMYPPADASARYASGSGAIGYAGALRNMLLEMEMAVFPEERALLGKYYHAAREDARSGKRKAPSAVTAAAYRLQEDLKMLEVERSAQLEEEAAEAAAAATKDGSRVRPPRNTIDASGGYHSYFSRHFEDEAAVLDTHSSIFQSLYSAWRPKVQGQEYADEADFFFADPTRRFANKPARAATEKHARGRWHNRETGHHPCTLHGGGGPTGGLKALVRMAERLPFPVNVAPWQERKAGSRARAGGAGGSRKVRTGITPAAPVPGAPLVAPQWIGHTDANASIGLPTDVPLETAARGFLALAKELAQGGPTDLRTLPERIAGVTSDYWRPYRNVKRFTNANSGVHLKEILNDLGKRLSSYPLVTGDGLRAWANWVIDGGRAKTWPKRSAMLARMRPGDTFFVRGRHLNSFYRKLHFEIPYPYVLITHNHGHHTALGTEDDGLGLSETARKLLKSPRVMSWWTVNPMVKHRKLRALPLGFANRYHTMGAGHPRQIGHGSPKPLRAARKKAPGFGDASRGTLVYVNAQRVRGDTLRNNLIDYFRAMRDGLVDPKTGYVTDPDAIGHGVGGASKKKKPKSKGRKLSKKPTEDEDPEDESKAESGKYDVVVTSRMVAYSKYLAKLSEAKFTLAVPGSEGYDTHRTWDALAVGSIPILVRPKPRPANDSEPLADLAPRPLMDSLYRGLPAVIVNETDLANALRGGKTENGEDAGGQPFLTRAQLDAVATEWAEREAQQTVDLSNLFLPTWWERIAYGPVAKASKIFPRAEPDDRSAVSDKQDDDDDDGDADDGLNDEDDDDKEVNDPGSVAEAMAAAVSRQKPAPPAAVTTTGGLLLWENSPGWLLRKAERNLRYIVEARLDLSEQAACAVVARLWFRGDESLAMGILRLAIAKASAEVARANDTAVPNDEFGDCYRQRVVHAAQRVVAHSQKGGTAEYPELTAKEPAPCRMRRTPGICMYATRGNLLAAGGDYAAAAGAWRRARDLAQAILDAAGDHTTRTAAQRVVRDVQSKLDAFGSDTPSALQRSLEAAAMAGSEPGANAEVQIGSDGAAAQPSRELMVVRVGGVELGEAAELKAVAKSVGGMAVLAPQRSHVGFGGSHGVHLEDTDGLLTHQSAAATQYRTLVPLLAQSTPKHLAIRALFALEARLRASAAGGHGAAMPTLALFCNGAAVKRCASDTTSERLGSMGSEIGVVLTDAVDSADAGEDSGVAAAKCVCVRPRSPGALARLTSFLGSRVPMFREEELLALGKHERKAFIGLLKMYRMVRAHEDRDADDKDEAAESVLQLAEV